MPSDWQISRLTKQQPRNLMATSPRLQSANGQRDNNSLFLLEKPVKSPVCKKIKKKKQQLFALPIYWRREKNKYLIMWLWIGTIMSLDERAPAGKLRPCCKGPSKFKDILKKRDAILGKWRDGDYVICLLRSRAHLCRCFVT